MRKILKNISLFLLIVFTLNIIPLPSIATSSADIISRLTPQQKDQMKNLSQEEKNKIASELGLEPKMVVTDNRQNNSSLQGSTEIPLSIKSTQLSEKSVLFNTNESEEMSIIEKSFLDINAKDSSGYLRQYGYDVFKKAVDNRFVTLPSIPLGPDYRINPGDSLLVTIWGNVNDTFSLDVDQRGSVVLPKVGVITVAGLSISEARDLIYQRLAKIFVTDFNIDLTIKEIGAIKVYLLGDFKVPGAYTLLSNTSFYDAIFVGGGPTKNGSLRSVDLVRDGRKIKTIDLYDFIISGSKRGDLLLENGDVIKISPINKVAAISGDVMRPAIYELKSKMELSKFFDLAGGVTPSSYIQRIQIERFVKNAKQVILDINYSDYLKNKNIKPIYVENRDRVAILSIKDTIRNVVYIDGSIVRPGQYELKSGMRLSDLILKAEGLAPETYMNRGQIFRLIPPDMKPEIIAFDLNKLKSGDLANNPLLSEFDRIRLFSKKEIEGDKNVYIAGEVNDGGGTHPLTSNMRVSDLVFKSGGLKESAYLEDAELARFENDKVYFYTINLGQAITHPRGDHDLLLKKDDYLFIKGKYNYSKNETVVLNGAVKYPGEYRIYKGERLSSLIKRAGGYTEVAFLDGAVFTREAILLKNIQDEKRIKSILNSKKNWETASIPFGLSSEETGYRERKLSTIYNFLDVSQGSFIPGRMIIDLKQVQSNKDFDIVLQHNDYLFIPEKSDFVNIFGEVVAPGAIIAEGSKGISSYVEACGGLTDFGDIDKAIIIRSNGKTEKNGFWVTAKAGDSIYIPAKTIDITKAEKPFNWNEFWDTASRASTAVVQSVTSFVTIYLLYKSVN